jgi:hypothetical protein
MKTTELKPGRIYRGVSGTRKVLSISGRGAFRMVQYRDGSQRRGELTITRFAEWAEQDATPVSVVRMGR